MAVVRRPPPTRTPHPQFQTLPAGSSLVRLYNPNPFHTTSLTFRTFGPLLRFDHHRRQKGKPCDNPSRGIYYAGLTLACCVVEVFGDIGVIECADYHVAYLLLKREVRLLDLRGDGAMRAGTLAAISSVPSRRLSQAWSNYFYRTPVFENVDGILYPNAHNGDTSVALYERAQEALSCPPSRVMRLDDPALRYYLLDVASRSHLVGPF